MTNRHPVADDPPSPAGAAPSRIAIAEGDRTRAEMLHTFFRLMGVDTVGVDALLHPFSTSRRPDPDAAIIDFDLPSLRAVELATHLRARYPNIRIVFISSRTHDRPDVVPKPGPQFEEMLALMEAVLDA